MTAFGKYHVVLSFASEDERIAQEIGKKLTRRGLKVYYYKAVNNFGDKLDDITRSTYFEKANNGVVLLSDPYQNKALTQEELYHMQSAQQEGYLKYIFFIRLQPHLKVPGPGRPVYCDWKGNAEEISKKIYDRIAGNGLIPPGKERIVLGLLLLLVVGLLVLILIYAL